MKQNNKKHLTAENGRSIADNQNTQTAGVRGSVTMQDPWLVEKLAHFDREVIPERRMHAKGSGAYGIFTVTHDITKYTRASIFAEVGKFLCEPRILEGYRASHACGLRVLIVGDWTAIFGR